MRHSIIHPALIALALLLAVATPAAAQTDTVSDGLLVRVSGDATVHADDELATVVVDGNLDMAGTATTIVVVNGTATLTEATADTLVVINGTAELGTGSTVTGDVQLLNSDLHQAPDATVGGEIRNDAEQFFAGFRLVGLLFMAGWAVLTVLAALVLAAVAPSLARTSGQSITAEPAKAIGAALVLWVAAPILGIAPYLAATIGTVLLIMVGVMPIVGPPVVMLAAFLGSGGLLLQAWRASRANPDPTTIVPIPSVADTPR